MNKKLKMVIVTWKDIGSNSSWEEEKFLEMTTPAICHTLGWLYSLDDNNIKILGTYSDEGGDPGDREDVTDTRIIPMGAVARIQYIGKRTTKNKKKKRRRKKKA